MTTSSMLATDNHAIDPGGKSSWPRSAVSQILACFSLLFFWRGAFVVQNCGTSCYKGSPNGSKTGIRPFLLAFCMKSPGSSFRQQCYSNQSVYISLDEASFIRAPYHASFSVAQVTAAPTGPWRIAWRRACPSRSTFGPAGRS